jgi:hypothetical protein
LRAALRDHGGAIFNDYESDREKHSERYSAILLPRTDEEQEKRLNSATGFRLELTVRELADRFDELMKPRSLYIATEVIGGVPPIPNRTDPLPATKKDQAEAVAHSIGTIGFSLGVPPVSLFQAITALSMVPAQPTPRLNPRTGPRPIPAWPPGPAPLRPDFEFAPFGGRGTEAERAGRYPYLERYFLRPPPSSAGEGVVVLRFVVGAHGSGPQSLENKTKDVEVRVLYETVPGVSTAEFQGVATPSLNSLASDRALVDSLVQSFGDLPVRDARSLVSARALDSLQRVTVLGFSISRRELPLAIFLLQLLVVAGIFRTATEAAVRGLDISGGTETDSAFELLLGRRARFITWVLLPPVAVGLALPPFPLSWGEYALATGGALLLGWLGLVAYRRSRTATPAPAQPVEEAVGRESVVSAGPLLDLSSEPPDGRRNEPGGALSGRDS